MKATRCLAHICVDRKRDLALVVVMNIGGRKAHEAL